MYKIIQPDAQDFDEEIVKQIRISNNSFTGSDKIAFQKRASEKLVHKLANLKKEPGEELIHMIAIGATEDYGPNRNGDGFKRATCEKYHPTFVKHAKFFRNHESKDPKKSYGIVKISEYNPDMKRIELVVGLNATKEAAERNNGLIADKELDKLQSGKDLGVSMACKVAYDVCSYCGNNAPQSKDYCEDIRLGGTCKAGGLKNNIGKLVEVDGELHHLHADNPHPSFFDISHVFKPADRVAYVTGAIKNASDNYNIQVTSGAVLAQLRGLVDEDYEEELKKLAADLSELENSLLDKEVLLCIDDDFVVKSSGWTKDHKLQAFSELANKGILLTPKNFFGMMGGLSKEAAETLQSRIQPYLPNIYTEILKEGVDLDTSMYDNNKSAATSVKHWCYKVAQDSFSTAKAVSDALVLSTVRRKASKPTSVKIASVDNTEIYTLAKEYALYKLATLHQNKENKNINLMKKLAIFQNCMLY